MENELPDEEVKVKISCCGKCQGIVRAAVSHYLEKDTKARNEFKSEVMQHNLSVKELPLLEYRKGYDKGWCTCNLPDIEESDEPEFHSCAKCDGHQACEDFGCAFELGLGRMVRNGEPPGLDDWS